MKWRGPKSFMAASRAGATISSDAHVAAGVDAVSSRLPPRRRTWSCARSTTTRSARRPRDLRWRPAATPPPSGWTVKREGNGRVLVHEGKPSPADSFAVAILSGAQYQDVQVSVRFKATGGGRTAGLVWKYQDPMNHYSAQLDLARQELAMYRVVNGNRIRARARGRSRARSRRVAFAEDSSGGRTDPRVPRRHPRVQRARSPAARTGRRRAVDSAAIRR